MSGSPQGAGGVGGLLEVSARGATTTNCFVAYDGNGNVMGLVNAADGTVLAQYEYGPFGELLRATGPMAKPNPLRFSTKYQDDETDLLYYGYRYEKDGRWLSRDPIEEDGGDSLYRFICNSPITQNDPLGLCGGPGPSCPCQVKSKLNDDKAISDMLYASIDWMGAGSIWADASAKDRVVKDFILLGREGGPLGFALLARTICGQRLKILALSHENRDFRAGWIHGELELDATYKWYKYVSPEEAQILKDAAIYNKEKAGAIVIAHELGHAFIGIQDPQNYRAVENPIRTAFHVPEREKYSPNYPDVPNEWIWPAAILDQPISVGNGVWKADMYQAWRKTTSFTIAWSCLSQ